MLLRVPRHLVLLSCGALLAALAGPASAQNVCARLQDSTGTVVEITDLGTIGRFLCHGIPFLDGQIQGFALCTGGVTGAASVTVAAATGAGGAAVTKGVSPASCFGIEGETLSVKLVNPERLGGAVVLRGIGNTRASRSGRNPSQAFAFDSADIAAEFGSCVPSASGTRDVTTGGQVAELFLNFRDDKGAGAVKLTGVNQSGSEVFYSFCINAD